VYIDHAEGKPNERTEMWELGVNALEINTDSTNISYQIAE